MEPTLARFQQRLSKPWIVDGSPQSAMRALEANNTLMRRHSGPVLLAETDPKCFFPAFLAAVGKQKPLILASPSWPAALWKDVPEIPISLTLGSLAAPSFGVGQTFLEAGSIAIATGGSGGQLRFALHTWSHLVAAIAGYQQFFVRETLHALTLLPLAHVGGLMPCLRTLLTGGRLMTGNWKEIESGVFPELPSEGFHISLVPTQLNRLLKMSGGISWLRQFEAILVGGGPCPEKLFEASIQARLPLFLAYGMTETAGTIALQPQDAPRSEAEPEGQVLPHLSARIHHGRILLSGKSLFTGYLGLPRRQSQWFDTGDEGCLTAKHCLKVFGRAGRSINSGGETIAPALVEAALLGTGHCEQAVVLGLPDSDWGECVCALLVGDAEAENAMRQKLCQQLPRYMLPKKMVWTEGLPQTAAGKIDLAMAKKCLLASIYSEGKKKT